MVWFPLLGDQFLLYENSIGDSRVLHPLTYLLLSFNLPYTNHIKQLKEINSNFLEILRRQLRVDI